MAVLLKKNFDAKHLFIFVFFPLQCLCVRFRGTYHGVHLSRLIWYFWLIWLLCPNYWASPWHCVRYVLIFSSFHSLFIFSLVFLQTFLFQFILKLCSNFCSDHLSLVCVRSIIFEIHLLAELSVQNVFNEAMTFPSEKKKENEQINKLTNASKSPSNNFE